jgi:hypothetical protein
VRFIPWLKEAASKVFVGHGGARGADIATDLGVEEPASDFVEEESADAKRPKDGAAHDPLGAREVLVPGNLRGETASKGMPGG